MRATHHPATPARSGGDGPVYAPRSPEATALYTLVQDHLDAFLAHAAATYERKLPRYVEQRTDSVNYGTGEERLDSSEPVCLSYPLMMLAGLISRCVTPRR
jgi:hypothetical protein